MIYIIESTSTIPWAAVGGGVGSFIIVLVLVITFPVIGIVYYKKKKSKHNGKIPHYIVIIKYFLNSKLWQRRWKERYVSPYFKENCKSNVFFGL